MHALFHRRKGAVQRFLRKSRLTRVARASPPLTRRAVDVYTVYMTTKARLLDSALEELERAGLEGFSLRSVGAAAGVTPMAVYRHFKNRDDLLAAVGEEAFAAWKARIEALDAADPMDWLIRAAAAYILFLLDEPARFDACFVLRTSVERLYPEDFRARKSPVVAMLVDRISEAQRMGALGAGDPLEMGMIYWAELHGLAMLHRCGRFSMRREDFLALCLRCVARVLDGMRNGATP